MRNKDQLETEKSRMKGMVIIREETGCHKKKKKKTNQSSFQSVTFAPGVYEEERETSSERHRDLESAFISDLPLK